MPQPLVPSVPVPGQPPRALCQVTPDPQTTLRWAHVQGGWSGGDGIFSVALHGGRTLWLFGDSIVSRPGQDGFAFVRNSAVIEERGGSLHTTDATAAGHETVGFGDSPDQRWLWPGAGFTRGSRLWLFESEMRRTAPGFWGFRYVRSWLFEMKVHRNRLAEVRRVALPRDGVIWGAAVIPAGGRLYIFGVRDSPTVKHPQLARADARDVLGAWTYWDGANWSDAPPPRAEWHGSVASEFSVVRVRRGIALVTASAFRGGVQSFRAHAMTGPWIDDGVIYQMPVDRGTFAYNPLLHPLPSGDFLLSYSTASLHPERAEPLTPAAMLPRFAHVPRACL